MTPVLTDVLCYVVLCCVFGSQPSKISYPKLDEDQLIDLGTEIEQPVPASGGSDIVAQLAELGEFCVHMRVCVCVHALSRGAFLPQVSVPLAANSTRLQLMGHRRKMSSTCLLRAEPRTARSKKSFVSPLMHLLYCRSTFRGSTYDDQQVKQEASLSDAVRGRTGQPQQPQEPM